MSRRPEPPVFGYHSPEMITQAPDRSSVLAVLAAHRDELSRFGIARLALVGSVARGEAGPESDVDLLVDFEGPATFDRYAGLSLLLEDLLGRRVDLLTRGSLRPYVGSQVEKDAVEVSGR